MRWNSTPTDVAARWDDWLDKSAGVALRVSADCRREELEGQGDTGWNVALPSPIGEGGCVISAGRSGWRRVPIWSMLVCKRTCPMLHRSLYSVQGCGGRSKRTDRPGDSASISTAYRRRADGAINLDFDATRAGCELPVSGVLTKSPGVDAKVAVRLHTVSPSRSPKTVTWRLEEGELHLAGLHLSEVTGTAETDAPVSQPAVAAFLRVLRPEPMPSLRSIDLETHGGLVIDKQVTGLHRKIRQWCERYGLSGRVVVRAKVTGTPEQLVVAGVVDADDLQCSASLGGDLVPTALPSRWVIPSRLTFDVSHWPMVRCGI